MWKAATPNAGDSLLPQFAVVLLQPLDLLSQILRPGLKVRQFVALFLHDVCGRLFLPIVLKPPSPAAIRRAIRAADGAMSKLHPQLLQSPSRARPALVRRRFCQSQHPRAYIIHRNDRHFAAIVKASAGVRIFSTR